MIGRGDEIRTHDTDFKDQCLRPLGDTPTVNNNYMWYQRRELNPIKNANLALKGV